MPTQYVSGARYARQLLNDPAEEVHALIRQVLPVVLNLGEFDQGSHILVPVDIYDGWGFDCDDLVVAEVLVELNRWPGAIQRLWKKFDANELVYEVAFREAEAAGDDDRVPEFGINVRVRDGEYVVAHVCRHPRFNCARLYLC